MLCDSRCEYDFSVSWILRKSFSIGKSTLIDLSPVTTRTQINRTEISTTSLTRPTAATLQYDKCSPHQTGRRGVVWPLGSVPRISFSFPESQWIKILLLPLDALMSEPLLLSNKVNEGLAKASKLVKKCLCHSKSNKSFIWRHESL